jgi:two-component system sensor histidine kinase ChvG
MLFPLALFFIGLFSIDQYRSVLVQAEFEALERQGRILARSLALEDTRERPFGLRGLAPQTMRHLLPLVGYGTQLRARVFQPSGQIMADTNKRGATRSRIRVKRKTAEPVQEKIRIQIVQMMSGLADLISNKEAVPIMNMRSLRHVDGFPDLKQSLSGEVMRSMWRNPRGQLVISVSLPIQDLRIVKGALLMTSTGGTIEREIENVQWAFVQLFVGILFVTVLLGLYLARSITRPIVFLASSADKLRQTMDTTTPLKGLPERKDEIGQLSQALVDMTAELQRRIQATAGFAADVAHEIKNPLSSLRSAVETVSRIDDAKQQRRLMDIILADIQRMDRLISDISQASRVDAELSIQPTKVYNLSELLENWASVFSSRHGSDVLSFDAPRRSVKAAIHSTRIIQILDNLVANAQTFHKGNLPIELSLKRERGFAVITMADRGRGLPEGKEDKIFQRFYSERPTNENFGQHSGLGLSIARQIANAHGGSLVAANRSDGGAIFTLCLPLAR